MDRRASKQTGPLTAAAVRYRYVGDTALLSEENGADARTRAYDYASDGERLGQATRLTTPSLQVPQPQSMTTFSYGTTGSGDVEDLEAAADPSSGTPVGRQYQYDPYGTVLNQGALDGDAAQNPFRYGGHYYDTGPDSYDLGARTYTPTTGRYLSQDRYEDASADQGLLADPLTNGRYAYVGGNPVNRMDWDGHDPLTDGGNTTTGRGGPGTMSRPANGEARRTTAAARTETAQRIRSNASPDRASPPAPNPYTPAVKPAGDPGAGDHPSRDRVSQAIAQLPDFFFNNKPSFVERTVGDVASWADGIDAQNVGVHEAVVPGLGSWNRFTARNGFNPGYDADNPDLRQAREQTDDALTGLTGGLLAMPAPPARVIGGGLRSLLTLRGAIPRAAITKMAGRSIAKYDADFAIGQLTSRGAKASDLAGIAESQGWRRVQNPNGPLKFLDDSGVPQ